MADVAQLLQSLHPMREPPPPAPVMPFLLMLGFGLAVAAVGFVTWRIALRRRTSLRRSAGLALAATRGLAREERLAAQARLLRRVVRAHAGDEAARAQGESWLVTLDRTFATTAFTRGDGRAYVDALYRRGGADDVEALDRTLEMLIGGLVVRKTQA